MTQRQQLDVVLVRKLEQRTRLIVFLISCLTRVLMFALANHEVALVPRPVLDWEVSSSCMTVLWLKLFEMGAVNVGV